MFFAVPECRRVISDARPNAGMRYLDPLNNERHKTRGSRGTKQMGIACNYNYHYYDNGAKNKEKLSTSSCSN